MTRPNFLKYIFPVLAFIFASLINDYLNINNIYVETSFSTLYLTAILVCAYLSGRPQALILTAAFFMKIVFVDQAHVQYLDGRHLEEILRLMFFTVGACIAINLIRRLKQTALENHNLRMAQQELLSVVSHDLRNPLNSILLNAEYMKKIMIKENGDEKLIMMAGNILKNCVSMDVLIKDLLELGRLSKTKSLDLSQVETSDLLGHIDELLRPLAEKKNLSFSVTDLAKTTFTADREKMLRVFSNLIGNAIKFTPDGGRVTMDASTDDKTIVFRVLDTGPGIKEDEVTKIFEEYWQAGLQKHKGLGLGLAISRSIVESHSGAISVFSQSGKGTTFTVTIPRTQA